MMRSLCVWLKTAPFHWADVGIGLLIAVLMYALAVGLFSLTASAQPPLRTRSWEVGGIFGIRVGVLDTGNVCIYVTDPRDGAGRAIAVVPKRNQGVNWSPDGTTGACQ